VSQTLWEFTPAGFLDFVFDWRAKTHGRVDENGVLAPSDWLAEGETISAYTVTATRGVEIDRHTEDDGTVTAWVKNGEDGKRVRVTCHVTTSLGRQDQRSLWLEVTPR
jgi:hypothetical protein